MMPPIAEPKKRRRWLRDLVIVLLVLLAAHFYQTRNTASGQAPAVVGEALGGGAVDLAAWRGQAVLVHFWATWCPVCRAEQSNIIAIAKDWPVLGVAMEDTSPAQLLAYLEKAGMNFSNLRDADGAIAMTYGVRAVPTSFVIDPRGQIRFTEVGYSTELGLRLRLWLAANGFNWNDSASHTETP